MTLTESSHRAANFLLARFRSDEEAHDGFPKIILTDDGAEGLSTCLKQDATCLFFNAYTSYALAVRDLIAGHYAWATVKFYYSSFYSVRSLYALSGTSLVYVNKPQSDKSTLYSLRAISGSRPEKGSVPNTHKFMCRLADRDGVPPFMKTQSIGPMPALAWLSLQRDIAQYKKPIFDDPSVPDTFKFFKPDKCDNILEQYYDDDSYLYAFDMNHAVVALPLAIIVYLSHIDSLYANTDILEDKTSVMKNLRVCGRKRMSVLSRIVTRIVD